MPSSSSRRRRTTIDIDGNKKLSAADRAKIFEGNTRRVFARFPASL